MEWNIRIKGQKTTLNYRGYKTKKEAKQIVDDWNNNPNHTMRLELVKLVNNEYVIVE